VAKYARSYDPASDGYDRPPFAADIKEGKNDPIYNAHSYHTKVPRVASFPTSSITPSQVTSSSTRFVVQA
jgi:hypothetical protein